MSSIRIARTCKLACALVFAAALLFACSMFVQPAYATKHLDAPTTVSDDITRLHVNKLDADTHEYVAGATMAIINEETGEVVDSWVTDNGVHENEKGLDVNVVYILRELEAPEGFDKVQDVRFMVNETEGTGITILSKGEDAELTESYKVALYDKHAAIENVITETSQNQTSNSANTTSGSKSNTTKAVAPKTGDEAPLSVVAGLVAVGVIAIIALQFAKKRVKE